MLFKTLKKDIKHVHDLCNIVRNIPQLFIYSPRGAALCNLLLKNFLENENEKKFKININEIYKKCNICVFIHLFNIYIYIK